MVEWEEGDDDPDWTFLGGEEAKTEEGDNC